MQEAQFDNNCVVWFAPKKRKALDLTRLQGAMFLDRPDLWQKKKHRTSKEVPPNQLKMFGLPT